MGIFYALHTYIEIYNSIGFVMAWDTELQCAAMGDRLINTDPVHNLKRSMLSLGHPVVHNAKWVSGPTIIGINGMVIWSFHFVKWIWQIVCSVQSPEPLVGRTQKNFHCFMHIFWGLQQVYVQIQHPLDQTFSPYEPVKKEITER
jgi:hypothetical protein